MTATNYNKNNNRVITITGATASGKTYASVEFAKIIDGEIINADSMQIYKNMKIGTAKPSEKEQCGIPHHLIDIRELNQTFNVAEYIKLANEKIKEVLNRGKIPIVCGGTGLYIDHLIQNTDFEQYENDFSVRKELNKKSDDELYNLLVEADKESSDFIHKNNRQRVIRALEIFYITGEKKSVLDKKAFQSKSDFEFLQIYLNYPNRDLLYERINSRVEQMIKSGLAEEVLTLAEKGYAADIKRVGAIGYTEIIAFYEKYGFELNGDIKKSVIFKEEVVEQIKKDTRNYAKRQITWFKRNKNSKNIDIDEKILTNPKIITDIIKESYGIWNLQ